MGSMRHAESSPLPRASAKACAAALLTVVTCGVIADQPLAPPWCALRLSVEVTPDVPNPRDGGFLSSLLGNHTDYQLFLLRQTDDTHVVLQLQGPGPAENCRAIVDSLRKDARVSSIRVH